MQRPQKFIWHGSLATGERAMDLYCDGWDSNSAEKVGLASSLLQQKLLGQDRYSCDQPLAVLCIEADSPTIKTRRRRNKNDHELSAEEYKQEYLNND